MKTAQQYTQMKENTSMNTNSIPYNLLTTDYDSFEAFALTHLANVGTVKKHACDIGITMTTVNTHKQLSSMEAHKREFPKLRAAIYRHLDMQYWLCEHLQYPNLMAELVEHAHDLAIPIDAKFNITRTLAQDFAKRLEDKMLELTKINEKLLKKREESNERLIYADRILTLIAKARETSKTPQLSIGWINKIANELDVSVASVKHHELISRQATSVKSSEVLRMIDEGMTIDAIARQLKVSRKLVLQSI